MFHKPNTVSLNKPSLPGNIIENPVNEFISNDSSHSEINNKHSNLEADNNVISGINTLDRPEVNNTKNTTIIVDYYKKPSKEQILQFLKYHPYKPDNINYNIDKIYFTNKRTGDTRKWISYSSDSKSFFCWICVAFGPKDEQSVFIDGCNDSPKHLYDRIKEHEISKNHKTNLESFLMFDNNKNIVSYFSKARQIKLREIKNNRNILERIIETIKMIGKRGLSYRGANEAAYTLDNDALDHGNLLEILILISKYDPILNNHIRESIEKSKKIHEKQNSKGRGNLVTFMSKTTANVIIEGITK